jgi:hypothetical protein
MKVLNKKYIIAYHIRMNKQQMYFSQTKLYD